MSGLEKLAELEIPLFDVVGVDLKTRAVRIMTAGCIEKDADAFVIMAVTRRGVDTEFFATVPSGSFIDGDKWRDAG